MALKVHRKFKQINGQRAQLGENTFLSSKHLDYLAVVAEFWSEVRA